MQGPEMESVIITSLKYSGVFTVFLVPELPISLFHYTFPDGRSDSFFSEQVIGMKHETAIDISNYESSSVLYEN